jgi:hypothetical protein
VGDKVMTLELKEPSLVRQIEQLASETRQPAEQVLEAAVQTYLDELESESIQADTEAFWTMHAKLFADYSEQFVAIRQGQLVDHDSDVTKLEERVRSRFGLLPVLIAPVTPAPPQELRWLGGRFNGNTTK